MNIINSIDARVKNHYIKHFENTKYGKELRKLKDKFLGERCFIVGNGPSLKISDLDKLKDEYTFAFNRIYYVFNDTDWRPTFYCIQDDKMIMNSIDKIKTCIKTRYIFAPIDFKFFYNINLNTSYYFCQRRNTDISNIYFSESIDKGISVCNTVTYTAIQLAVYMGFTNIYLIGIDHCFNKVIDSNGNITKRNINNYFCEEYDKDKDDLYIPNLDLSTKAYERALSYTKLHPSIKILNATRGGELEVFNRESFDSLF